MFKVIWLMKRKAGITRQQFRDHYESSHAVKGKHYFGHLWVEYRRNYVEGAFGGSPAPEGGFGPIDFAYDCIAEWVFPDEAAYNEVLRISANPQIGKEFSDDEALFIESKALIMLRVDAVNDGTGDGSGTLTHASLTA